MVLREYIENAAMQPIHLIVYRALITPAIAGDNPIYSIVAIGFVIPAYNWFAKLLDGGRAETAKGGKPSAAGAALAMSGLQALSKIGAGGSKVANAKKGSNDSDDSDDDIFMPRDDDGDLTTFGGNEPKEIGDDEDNDGNLSAGGIETNNQDQNGGEPLGGGSNKPENDYNFNEYEQAEIEKRVRQDRLNATREDINNAGGEAEFEKQNRAKHQAEIEKNKQKGIYVPRPGAKRRIAGRALKAGAKMALKGSIFAAKKGAQVGLAGTGAALGGIISIGTGQPEKLATNMMAGAVAGNLLGKNAPGAITGLASGISSAAQNTVNNAQNAINEETYGYSEAREMRRQKQTEKARKAFYKDSSQIRKCRSMASEIPNFSGNLKDVQDAVFDMRTAGITDDKLITNTLKAEYKRDGELNGKNHKKFVDAAAFSHQNGIGYKDIAESKSREKVETMIQGKVSGDKAQGEAERMISEIFGAGNIYEQHGKLGKASKQPVNKSKEANQNKTIIVDKNGNPIGGGQQPINKPTIVDKNGNPIG